MDKKNLNTNFTILNNYLSTISTKVYLKKMLLKFQSMETQWKQLSLPAGSLRRSLKVLYSHLKFLKLCLYNNNIFL